MPGNMFPFTRYSDRILISHKATRSHLKKFASDGLSDDEIQELVELTAVNAPYLNQFVEYLVKRCENISYLKKCPQKWSEIVLALASASPVCALIHPGDEFHELLTKILNKEVDLDTLQILQEECPLLFEILRESNSLPSQFCPVLRELLKRSKAPFNVPENVLCNQNIQNNDDGYFPTLPIVRSRGSYVADSRQKAKICTKRGSSHPTLLPGIFTLFCSHGMRIITVWAKYASSTVYRCLLWVSNYAHGGVSKHCIFSTFHSFS